MNNLKYEILQNIFNQYKLGKFNDIRFLLLVIECLNNHKDNDII